MVKYLKKILLLAFSYLPSSLKLTVYRILGARIGKNIELGLGSYILPFDGDFKKIRIENGGIIEDGVHILAKSLVIGEESQIKSGTRIWGQSSFSLGKGCYIDQDCHIDLRRDITFGNMVAVGGGSWFYTHMVFHSVLNGAPFAFGAISLGDRAYLGANVFILPGISIGPDAMVGARAVVTKNVCADAIVVGNPAHQIGLTSERNKNMSLTEKQDLVLEILKYFTVVQDRRVTILQNQETNGLLFRYGHFLVYYSHQLDDIEQLDRIERSCHQEPAVIISFGIPKSVKEYCDVHRVAWFDMAYSWQSPVYNLAGQKIAHFFGDYGIRFAS